MIDPLDYDRSIMELQLKKQKLEEEITTATGWCVNSIDYCYVLN